MNSHWRMEEGLFVDPDVKGLGRLPHGVTSRSLGDMKESGLRAAAFGAAKLGTSQHRLLRQIHGNRVVEARNREEDVPEADGWITSLQNVTLAIYIADCLPVFMWDREASVVGIFHAGWKGLAYGMIRSAINAFAGFQRSADQLSAAVGPHIGACCYSVGPEVSGLFRPGAIKPGKGTAQRVSLDLGEEARLQCLEAGLSPGSISVSADCTSCRPGDFFSFRRDKSGQRMMAFISRPGAA